VLRLDKIEDAGNTEFGGEFLGAHRVSFPREPSSRIAARRRHHAIWHTSRLTANAIQIEMGSTDGN